MADKKISANSETESHKRKAKAVKELAEKIKKSKTLMIVSIKGLRSRQFQEIKKQIRKDVYINVSKKNIFLRAIKEIGNDSVLGLEKYIGDSCAFAISDIDGFELAVMLSKQKTPVFAKAGQIAPADIEVKDGPTSLVPGPAISELGAVGLEISVENGKIAIRKAKVVVKQGVVIKENVAAILQKLDIKPFNVGLEAVTVYDVKTGKIYTDIKVDSEAARTDLVESASKALGLAQKISYYAKETMGYLLAKANMNAKAIENKVGGAN
jgi:large subunit ribosomal protein L10